MIKANELRLGNWICEAHQTNTPIYQITSVNSISDMIEVVSLGNIKHIPLSLALPVAVTEWWLQRFGFEESGDYWREDSELFYIESDLLTQWIAVNPNYSLPISKPFRYVHQLQNLYFALTGEELEIKE